MAARPRCGYERADLPRRHVTIRIAPRVSSYPDPEILLSRITGRHLSVQSVRSGVPSRWLSCQPSAEYEGASDGESIPLPRM